MRTSGKGSDLTILLVPLVVLIAIGMNLAGDPGQLFRTTERALWGIVESVGTWVSSLL
jgi:hypothetical protein